MNSSGTQVVWDNLSDASLAHYEVFRATTSGFTAGSGNYLGSVSANHYYDSQVKTGLTNTYYYKVRAVRAGFKGTPSAAAQAISGTITDTTAPSAPGNLKGLALYGNRVSLAWETSTDNLYVKGYKVYRNGGEIKDVDQVLNSYLDTSTVSGGSYDYYVKAYDSANNLSAASNTVTVNTAGGPTPVPGNIASQAGFSASSEYSSNFAASKVADNIIGIQDSGEWASKGEVNPWIQLNW
jgi:fibronectin type 3 domain-containing protein